MEIKREILKILKTEEKWTVEEFCKHFKITTIELFETLILIIDEEIKKLTFDANVNRYKYLYKIFKYFDYLEDEKEIEFVFKKLNKINKYCSQVLTRAFKNDNQKAINNNVYHKIMDIIDVTLLKLDFEQKTIDSKENNNDYNFIHELIYNIKNYDYVYETFRSFHKLMYVKNYENKPLLEELIEHYIKIVMDNENRYDIIYFEKVIKIFLDSPKFKMDKEYIKYLTNKLLLINDDLKRHDIKKKEVERIKFFLNEVVNDLRKNNEYNDYEKLNYKYGITPSFKENILEEVKNTLIFDKNKYTDFRDKFAITIDFPGTKMYDDACFFEKQNDGTFELGVFVADVDAYIRPDSGLDQTAFKKSETIYLIHEQVNMFPRNFSDKLSLKKNIDRYTIGYIFKFDPQMNLINFYASRAVINVKYNLDYYDVSKCLDKFEDNKLCHTLKSMLEASIILRDKNARDPQYQDVKTIKRTIENSDRLEFKNGEGSIFSTFIILMNHYIAEYFNNNSHIPFPYHVNLSKYDDYIIKDLKVRLYNHDDFESIWKCLNEIYVPSFYSTENLGHNGLNLDSYANASNPLRQYISLITERLVKYHLIDGIEEPIISLSNMNHICEYTNNRHKLNSEYKQEYIKILQNKKY